MRLTIRVLASFLLVLLFPAGIAAQRLQDIAGEWALDRTVSAFGPGDPGAERIQIAMSATDVTLKRFFFPGAEPSVWTLALDGSAPPAPKSGSALVSDGNLIITHMRPRQVVTHSYTVEGNTLSVERTISSDTDSSLIRHLMVYRRIG